MAEPHLSIEVLIQRYAGDLYRLALAILHDPDDAEDAVQASFIAAARALPEFAGRSSLRTWLYRITANTSLSLLRRRKARRALHSTLEAVFRRPADVEEQAARRDERERLWQAVDALDEKHRLPVVLFYQHELPVSEIAEVLEINEGTVHSRLFTARKTLLKRLEGEFFQPGEVKETLS